MKKRYTFFGQYSDVYRNGEELTIELDKCYADRLYVALLASKKALRRSVSLSEEYDFVCDLLYQLGKYRRSK